MIVSKKSERERKRAEKCRREVKPNARESLSYCHFCCLCVFVRGVCARAQYWKEEFLSKIIKTTKKKKQHQQNNQLRSAVKEKRRKKATLKIFSAQQIFVFFENIDWVQCWLSNLHRLISSNRRWSIFIKIVGFFGFPRFRCGFPPIIAY